MLTCDTKFIYARLARGGWRIEIHPALEDVEQVDDVRPGSEVLVGELVEVLDRWNNTRVVFEYARPSSRPLYFAWRRSWSVEKYTPALMRPMPGRVVPVMLMVAPSYR